MAIDAKLNAQWAGKEQADAVFQLRAEAQACYIHIAQAVAKFDELTASTKFTTVDGEIKAEGAAVRSIINKAKAELDSHTEFLNWKKP